MDLTMRPIGVVHSTRTQDTDDNWQQESASIKLDAERFKPDSLKGLDQFSHVQVIFVMHSAGEGDMEKQARHPRDRWDLPEVGIFAQRSKDRPNRIGLSTCRILEVEGIQLRVEGLDAIDGSPVL